MILDPEELAKRAYDYLQIFGVNASTNGWYRITCPWCKERGKERDLRVHFGFDWWNCMSASCDRRGKLVEFVVQYEGVDYLTAKRRLEDREAAPVDIDLEGGFKVASQLSEVELPEGFRTIQEGDGRIAERARRYLRDERGLSIEELDREGVGYVRDPEDRLFGYIIIPYKAEGRIVYYGARDFMGTENRLRYVYPKKEEVSVGRGEVLYNEDLLFIEDEMFITEGVFDALTLGNAVDLGGLTLSDVQLSKLINSNVDRFYLALDEGAEREALKMANRILDHKPVHFVPLEGGDPNELGREHVVSIAERTEPLTRGNIIKRLADAT